MSFCPICGTHHDPTVPCIDRAGELLRDAGLERQASHLSKRDLRNAVRQANRFVLIMIAVLIGAIFLGALLFSLSQK
jgi:hypothetical protein